MSEMLPVEPELPPDPVQPELTEDVPQWQEDAQRATHAAEAVKSGGIIEVRPLQSQTLTLEDVGKIGRVFAQSGYFKDGSAGVDAAKAITKILAGHEIGVPPFQAMSQFHVIQGKPTMSAALIGALVKRSGRYNYRPTATTSEACSIDWYETGENIGTSTFTMKDAERAGLLSNPSWKKYPVDMLFARALTAGARRFCPDVFGGSIYTPDELGGEVVGND